MIVDTSALLAIVPGEPDADRFMRAIADSNRALLPAPNWVEATIVLEGRNDPALQRQFRAYVEDIGMRIAPFEARHARAAGEAWSRFGRGRHPARLNYGDCMAYGFARAEGDSLLFKGDDFALTDIEPALKD